MKNPWLTVLVYLILGPLIGFAIFLGFAGVSDGRMIFLLEWTKHIGSFLAGAYMFGGLPAVAAGIGVTGLREQSAQSFGRVTLVGIVVGVIFALVWSLANNWEHDVTLGQRLWETGKVMALLSALCAPPTIGCWLAVRVCDVWLSRLKYDRS
jgi:hypothetical protein